MRGSRGRRCWRLPLALSVVGALLRGADAAFWRDTVGLLRAASVSFQTLKPEMQKRYRV